MPRFTVRSLRPLGICQCNLLRHKFMFYFHCYKKIRKNEILILSIDFGRKRFHSFYSQKPCFCLLRHDSIKRVRVYVSLNLGEVVRDNLSSFFFFLCFVFYFLFFCLFVCGLFFEKQRQIMSMCGVFRGREIDCWLEERLKIWHIQVWIVFQRLWTLQVVEFRDKFLTRDSHSWYKFKRQCLNDIIGSLHSRKISS